MLGGLRDLVRDLNFGVHGLAVTVTPPNAIPVETRAIWVTPITEAFPMGFDVQRRVAPRVLALRRDAVPAVPRGTLITIAPVAPATLQEVWRVDGMERAEGDHWRVLVVPEPAA
jgi:hypothetical protein